MSYLTGLIPSPPDKRDYPLGSIVRKVALPEEVRLDTKIIRILDQKQFGTCVAKAGNGIVSSTYIKKLSSLFLYTKCKELDGIPNQQGTYPRIAMKVMHKYGICPEHLLPYDILTNHNNLPALNDDMYNKAKKYTITKYARINSLYEIKQAIASGHMVMGGILLGDNFMNYEDGVLGNATGNKYGYHAVIFCGYKDSLQAVRGVNSWGKNWGINGLFWMSYDTISDQENLIEAWIVEIDEKPEKEKPYVDRIYRCIKEVLS